MLKIGAETTTFLNVDLQIRVKSGMKKLLEGFGSSVEIMNNNPEDEYACIEIAHIQPRSIDEAIMLYFKIIKKLPRSARTIWESAESRCMSIGIQGGKAPHQSVFELSEKTISTLSSMRTTASITVYGTTVPPWAKSKSKKSMRTRRKRVSSKLRTKGSTRQRSRSKLTT